MGMWALTLCGLSLRVDKDNTFEMTKSLMTYLSREFCKIWEHLWDKRARIFAPVVAGKAIVQVLDKSGEHYTSLFSAIAACVSWMADLLEAVPQ